MIAILVNKLAQTNHESVTHIRLYFKVSGANRIKYSVFLDLQFIYNWLKLIFQIASTDDRGVFSKPLQNSHFLKQIYIFQ